MQLNIYFGCTQWKMAKMPFLVLGHGGCNNRSELSLSLLVNVKLRDKSERNFMAHVGDVRMNMTEGRVFLFALACSISSAVRKVSGTKFPQRALWRCSISSSHETWAHTYLLLLHAYLEYSRPFVSVNAVLNYITFTSNIRNAKLAPPSLYKLTLEC